jgi:aminopeptidase N
MMLKEVFPDVDEGINFAQYAAAAYSVDRTSGTNAIQQRLDNLDDAGLLYGNIIYDKAPMVMDMLYRKCGPEAFRKSMQEYLSAFPYGNATWDQLVDIMDSNCPDDLKEWSRMWVKKAGMPVVELSCKDTLLHIRQKDAYLQNIALRVALASRGQDGIPNMADTCIDLRGKKLDVAFKVPVKAVVPNPDARSYGCFLLDSASAAFCMGPYIYGRPQTERSSILITLNENVLKGNLLPEKFLGFLIAYLGKEEDPLLFSQAMGYLDRIYFVFFQDYKEAFPNMANGPDPGYYDDLTEGGRVAFSYDRLEDGLWDLMERKQDQQCRKSILKVLMSECYGQNTTRRLFEIFFNPLKNSPVALSEGELTQLAFELAVRSAETPLPEINVQVSQILAYQRARITQPDRLQRFDFISQAVSPDSTLRDRFFNSLLSVEGRPAEPWVTTSLSLLNHPLREKYSVKYISPGLKALPEIQRNGDIFLPSSWCSALLSNHNSNQARLAVTKYLKEGGCPRMLKGKILQNVIPKYDFKRVLEEK